LKKYNVYNGRIALENSAENLPLRWSKWSRSKPFV